MKTLKKSYREPKLPDMLQKVIFCPRLGTMAALSRLASASAAPGFGLPFLSLVAGKFNFE